MTREQPSAHRQIVADVVNATPAYDIHTHIYDPAFGELLLWGIDDLLSYHYLVAEVFRWLDLPYDKFFSLPKVQQAEIIWDKLFLEHSPVSEACRGVLTTLNALGFDVKKRDLAALRQHYAKWKVEDFIGRVFSVAKVRRVCMTNSPFDELRERPSGNADLRRAMIDSSRACGSILYYLIGKTLCRSCAPGDTMSRPIFPGRPSAK